MFKKLISFALVLVMILSVAAVAASAAEDEELVATGDGNVIYFDTKSANWGSNFTKVFFHIWAIDDSGFQGYQWGTRKQQGTDAGDGIWKYDLDAAGLTLKAGCQYAVIFHNDLGAQTYNLLFGTPCIGKTAACNGTIYENPEDSKKTTQAAFWQGVSASKYGPELKITSIGNVVGTCCPQNTTRAKMLTTFLGDAAAIANARTNNPVGDQVMIDTAASKLGLGKVDVKKAIADTGAAVDWSEDLSDLPDEGAELPATGQDATMIYVMLGVMIAAAGVIFFARRRARG